MFGSVHEEEWGCAGLVVASTGSLIPGLSEDVRLLVERFNGAVCCGRTVVCDEVVEIAEPYVRTQWSRLLLLCLDSAPHLLVADRPFRIGVSEPSVHHLRKSKFPEDLFVGAVLRLVL